jgi:hypothetical protein
MRRRYSKVVWPGFSDAPAPRHVVKVGRNDPCPCGAAGKKYKDCHEKAGDAYLEKLAHQDERKELKVLRQRLKEQGVPWYRRLFYIGSRRKG